MEQVFIHMSYWHWLALAAITLIIEMVTGTGFLLWVGIAAAVTGLSVAVYAAMSFGMQLLVFSLLALLSVICWRWYLHWYPIKTDEPKLNRRAEQYVGRIFTLQAPIVNGRGSTHVDDSMWRVRCNQELPAGASVCITGVDGVVLLAQAVPEEGRTSC